MTTWITSFLVQALECMKREQNENTEDIRLRSEMEILEAHTYSQYSENVDRVPIMKAAQKDTPGIQSGAVADARPQVSHREKIKARLSHSEEVQAQLQSQTRHHIQENAKQSNGAKKEQRKSPEILEKSCTAPKPPVLDSHSNTSDVAQAIANLNNSLLKGVVDLKGVSYVSTVPLEMSILSAELILKENPEDPELSDGLKSAKAIWEMRSGVLTELILQPIFD